jgi:hypothetical protein
MGRCTRIKQEAIKSNPGESEDCCALTCPKSCGLGRKGTLHEDYEDLNHNYSRRNSRNDSTSNSPNAKPG